MSATFVFPPIPYKFSKTPYPPLGIGYLASVLKAQDVQINLIDGQIIEEEQFWQEINNLTTDVVLISATILNFSFLTPFPNTTLYTATRQWIGDWDYEQWDDFDATVYTCKLEIDPREARDIILNAYLKKIASGMPHSKYQFANDT